MSAGARASTVLLLLLCATPSCDALLGSASRRVFDKIKRKTRSAVEHLTPSKVQDTVIDDHASVVATQHERTAHTASSSSTPNFETLAELLGHTQSWLETKERTSAEQVHQVLSSNEQLQDVIESCRSLIEHVEQSQRELMQNVAYVVVGPPQPPRTLVGDVAHGYEALVPYVSRRDDLPVEMLIDAIENQATHSSQLGTFMQLIVKIDRDNMRTVREAWARHGKPSTLGALLEAEVAAGVIQPTRLEEGSAALSLLWSMRMKRFWTIVADGFADTDSTEPTSAFGLRAYEKEVEPYHGFLLKNTFRTGLRALPNRETMLSNMETEPPAATLEAEGDALDAQARVELTPEERRATCLADLRSCCKATELVADYVQGMLDDLGLHDDRRL